MIAELDYSMYGKAAEPRCVISDFILFFVCDVVTCIHSFTHQVGDTENLFYPV